MMKTCFKIFLCFFFLFPVFIIYTCTRESDTKITGTGSETGNVAFVSGRLYNSDGTPAEYAKVYFVTSDHLPSVSNPLAKPAGTLDIADSATTDPAGWFGFDTLPADTYNVFGKSPAGNLSYQDSVTVTGERQVIDNDTLDLPGSLLGYLKMEPGDDPRTVTMYVIGATRYALPEQDASFSLTDMAEGTYRVRILSTLDKYLPLDTTLTIEAGTDLDLTDSIPLPLRIPKITGLTVSYDTLKQIVTLSWDKADTNKIKGYNVYRQHVDSTDIKLNVQALTDTFYVDSTGMQDESYVYSVVGVDLNGEEGIKVRGDSIEVVSSFELAATYGNGTGTGDGYFSGLRGVAIDNQGNIFTVDEGNNRIQKFDNSGNFLMSWGSQGSDSGQFDMPFDVDIDSNGDVYVLDRSNDRIQKFDNDGIFISQWDSLFNEPYKISLNDSIVLIGEWAGRRIFKFDLSGNLSDILNITVPVSGISSTDSLISSTDSLFFAASDSMILKYSIDGSLIDTIFTTAYIPSAGMSPGIRCLEIGQSTIYFSTSVEIGSIYDAIIGINFEGEIVKQYIITSGNGVPQAIYYSSGSIFVANHNGYINQFIVE